LGDAGGLTEQDWLFQGDAGVIVPELLQKIIAEVKVQ